jgi:hypothetical protein
LAISNLLRAIHSPACSAFGSRFAISDAGPNDYYTLKFKPEQSIAIAGTAATVERADGIPH